MMGNMNGTEFNKDEFFVDNMTSMATKEVGNDEDDFYDDEIPVEKISELKFDEKDNEPREMYVDIEDEPDVDIIKPAIFDDKNDQEDLIMTPDIFCPKDETNEIEKKEDDSVNILFDKEEVNPIDLNLSKEEMDQMIAEDANNTDVDSSSLNSNFDVLFDGLYNDVNGANNFISNLIEQKKSVNVNEATVNELQDKLEKEKAEFAKYVEAQKQSIDAEKEQCNEYIKNQRIRLQNEEIQFNSDMEAAHEERKLAEESIKIATEKLDDEKGQFEKYKEIEEQKIVSERQKIDNEKEQFKNEKQIELEKIKNAKKELEAQKEQFAKTKELEEKKLELESKNLSQSCARFKELVSQFNSGFQQLPGDNK